MDKEIVAEVVEAAGGQTKLALAVGVSQGHVSSWVRRGKLPAGRVLKIEAVTGISRHKLRPDIFGDAAQTNF